MCLKVWRRYTQTVQTDGGLLEQDVVSTRSSWFTLNSSLLYLGCDSWTAARDKD